MRTASQLKLAVVVILFICIVQNGTLLGVTAALFRLFKDAYVETEETDHFLTDGHRAVLQTAAASFSLPLETLPVMGLEQLNKIERIAVTFSSGGGTALRGSFAVSATVQRSNTWAQLSLNGGGSVEVINGSALLVRDGERSEVCSGDVTCAALHTDDAAVAEALVASAHAALDAAGVAHSRRRLFQGCVAPGTVARCPDWECSVQGQVCASGWTCCARPRAECTGSRCWFSGDSLPSWDACTPATPRYSCPALEPRRHTVNRCHAGGTCWGDDHGYIRWGSSTWVGISGQWPTAEPDGLPIGAPQAALCPAWCERAAAQHANGRDAACTYRTGWHAGAYHSYPHVPQCVLMIAGADGDGDGAPDLSETAWEDADTGEADPHYRDRPRPQLRRRPDAGATGRLNQERGGQRQLRMPSLRIVGWVRLG